MQRDKLQINFFFTLSRTQSGSFIIPNFVSSIYIYIHLIEFDLTSFDIFSINEIAFFFIFVRHCRNEFGSKNLLISNL